MLFNGIYFCSILDVNFLLNIDINLVCTLTSEQGIINDRLLIAMLFFIGRNTVCNRVKGIHVLLILIHGILAEKKLYLMN